MSLNEAKPFLVAACPFSFAHGLCSLLAAVHSQPGPARANTIIIPMNYFCLAPAADIHTAPTIGTMEGGAGVHS